ncbi:MAG: structural cement protein Gp24 [Terriglobales bacterium]
MAVTGFQQFVNNIQPPGIPGDFADANIRSSVIANPGGFVAGVSGANAGTFAWGDPATGLVDSYYKLNSALGFVRREMNALITAFLGIATSKIVPGNIVTLMNQGSFWGLFAAGATFGQKVYVDPITGALTGAATGQGVTANSTAASLATTGVLTVGATLTGTLAVGQAVTNAAGTIPPGSYITSQLTGTAGSTGTYQLANVNGTAFAVVGSGTVNFWGVQETSFYVAETVTAGTSFTASIAAPVAPSNNGIMTITAIGSGVPAPGQFLAGTGIGANVQILSQLTGTTGSTGTYLTNYSGTAITSETITGSQGQVGKISSWGP